MTLSDFLNLRGENHQFTEDAEQASFRARGYQIGWYSTQTLDALPSKAKPVRFKEIPPCLRSGFTPKDIVKAWRYRRACGELSRYYFQDRDGDLQSAQ